MQVHWPRVMGKKTNNIFHDLATLSGAGITMQEATQICASSYQDEGNWSKVAYKLSQGETLANALGQNGLITQYEQAIIAVAEFSGKTEQALNWLATSHEKRERRVSQLRSKLIFPIAVLIIGIAAAGILALLRNPTISVLTILMLASVIIAIVIIVTRIMLNFLRNDPANVIVSVELFRYSNLYKYLFEQLLFTALVWNSRAGINFKTGLLKTSNLINSNKLKAKLKMASSYCGQGMTVAESIKMSGLPITTELQQMLKIAEESGRWEQAVDHYLKQQQVMLDMKIESALEWLPRVYYFFIVVFVGAIIV